VRRHNLRRVADGSWVCSGGPREQGKGMADGLGCPFSTRDYVAAVNHATQNGARPPDMPRDLWVTA
jgi:hypothetical protein